MLRAGFAGNDAGAFADACSCGEQSLFVPARLRMHAACSRMLLPAPLGFDALSKFHPVGRICEPEEIAQARLHRRTPQAPQTPQAQPRSHLFAPCCSAMRSDACLRCVVLPFFPQRLRSSSRSWVTPASPASSTAPRCRLTAASAAACTTPTRAAAASSAAQPRTFDAAQDGPRRTLGQPPFCIHVNAPCIHTHALQSGPVPPSHANSAHLRTQKSSSCSSHHFAPSPCRVVP